MYKSDIEKPPVKARHNTTKGDKGMKVVKFAAAKVNLLLDITARLKNGYHSIYTVMQSVGIFDKITVSESFIDGITINCSDPEIPTGEKNIAYKAATAFFQETGIDKKGLFIDIEKNIPSMAGMAGGSADAAGVIVALNELYGTHLNYEALVRIGAKVGADVPFCIFGGLMLAQDTGIVLSPLPALPEYHLVIVKPKAGVSTKEAYDAYDAKDWIRHPLKEQALRAVMEGDIREFFSLSSNVFEQAIDARDRIEIKSLMRSHNCLYTAMTGSGSAVFGVFSESADAEECFKKCKKVGWNAFLTKPVSKGVFDESEVQ
jgi:4-diphosphocytidyl-2-C-methyl-D-erythritol kinase